MKKLKGCLGVFLIFFFGVIFGVVITAGVIHEKVRDVVEGGPDKVVEVVVNRLKSELKLDEAQQLKLQQIVADTQIRLRQIRDQTQPQVHQTLTDAEQRVREILYANQMKKFEEIVKAGRDKWKPEGMAPAQTKDAVVEPPASAAAQ